MGGRKGRIEKGGERRTRWRGVEAKMMTECDIYIALLLDHLWGLTLFPGSLLKKWGRAWERGYQGQDYCIYHRLEQKIFHRPDYYIYHRIEQ